MRGDTVRTRSLFPSQMMQMYMFCVWVQTSRRFVNLRLSPTCSESSVGSLVCPWECGPRSLHLRGQRKLSLMDERLKCGVVLGVCVEDDGPAACGWMHGRRSERLRDVAIRRSDEQPLTSCKKDQSHYLMTASRPHLTRNYESVAACICLVAARNVKSHALA